MAVLLHYRVTRPQALTGDEIAVARGLAAAHNATFAFDGERLTLDATDGRTLEGTTALPARDPFATFLGLVHWCRALTELRRSLPGTTWQVRVDDEPVPWDDEAGFGWAEQRDPATLQLMEQMHAGA